MALAVRYQALGRRFDRRGREVAGAVGTLTLSGETRAGPDDMADSRTEKVNSLRERIQREQYQVDPPAVAAAIVERLIARRSAWEQDQRSR